jgi:hypothetical protein
MLISKQLVLIGDARHPNLVSLLRHLDVADDVIDQTEKIDQNRKIEECCHDRLIGILEIANLPRKRLPHFDVCITA